MGSKATDISDFETPEKSAAWWKIPQEVRNNVKALKLDNIGINKVDKFAPAAGYGDSAVENGTMSIGLYCDDTEQTLARYPNGGSNFIKVISDSDGEVAYEGTRPNRWKNADNEFVKDIKYIAENPPYMNTVKTDIKIGEYVLKDGYYYTKVTLTAKNISAEQIKYTTASSKSGGTFTCIRNWEEKKPEPPASSSRFWRKSAWTRLSSR